MNPRLQLLVRGRQLPGPLKKIKIAKIDLKKVSKYFLYAEYFFHSPFNKNKAITEIT